MNERGVPSAALGAVHTITAIPTLNATIAGACSLRFREKASARFATSHLSRICPCGTVAAFWAIAGVDKAGPDKEFRG